MEEFKEETPQFTEFEGRFVRSSPELFECPDADCKVETNLAIICPVCQQNGRFEVFHDWEAARNHYENFYKDDPDHIIVNPFKELTISELNQTLGLTVKKDETTKAIIFFAMLLAQTKDNQFNVMQSARSSTGKSYIPLEIQLFFHQSEVLIYSGASPTAFFHEKGEWVIEKNDRFVPLDEELQPFYEKLEETKKNNDEKRKLKKEIAKLVGKAKILVDLEKKILIFVDQPHVKLLERMRPLFSHDQKYIEVPITDQSGHGGKRTKHIIVFGYPSVIFCTTFSKLDEQESTRNFILSPESSQDKISQALDLLDQKLANKESFEEHLEQNLERKALQFRIEMIRASGIDSIEIRNGLILNRFKKTHAFFNPRATRDFARIYALAYGNALLNTFQRSRENNTITANGVDVEAAFALYEPIMDANESGISPELFNLYNDIICPAYRKKNKTKEKEGNSPLGVTYSEIALEYRRSYHQSVNVHKLKDEVQSLVNAGLIEEGQDPDDKRRSVFTPLESELDRKMAHEWSLYIPGCKDDRKGEKNKPIDNAPIFVNPKKLASNHGTNAPEKINCVACGKVIETIPRFENGKAYHIGCFPIVNVG